MEDFVDAWVVNQGILLLYLIELKTLFFLLAFWFNSLQLFYPFLPEVNPLQVIIDHILPAVGTFDTQFAIFPSIPEEVKLQLFYITGHHAAIKQDECPC